MAYEGCRFLKENQLDLHQMMRCEYGLEWGSRSQDITHRLPESLWSILSSKVIFAAAKPE